MTHTKSTLALKLVICVVHDLIEALWPIIGTAKANDLRAGLKNAERLLSGKKPQRVRRRADD